MSPEHDQEGRSCDRIMNQLNIDQVLYGMVLLAILILVPVVYFYYLPGIDATIGAQGTYTFIERKGRGLGTQEIPLSGAALVDMRNRLAIRAHYLSVIFLLTSFSLAAIVRWKKGLPVAILSSIANLSCHGLGILIYGWPFYASSTHTFLDLAFFVTFLTLFLVAFHIGTRYDILPDSWS